ncbi:MAG: hypothetical protein KTR31_32465 [Myxococcales bacterium]|nr:hypothetical protein [Myxococcales bacterium]
MVRWLGVSLFTVVVACGGSETDGPSVTDGSQTAELGDICDAGIPTFELSGCEPVQDAFEKTWEAASDCLTDDDCQVLDGMCSTLVSGACWVPANTCLDQGDLSVIAAAYNCEACNGDCRGSCGGDSCPPPYDVTCERPDPAEFGKCEIVVPTE